jgi:hypothetical protein
VLASLLLVVAGAAWVTVARWPAGAGVPGRRPDEPPPKGFDVGPPLSSTALVPTPVKIKGLQAWEVGVAKPIDPFGLIEVQGDLLMLGWENGPNKAFLAWDLKAYRRGEAPFGGRYATLSPDQTRMARGDDVVVEIWEKGAPKPQRKLHRADAHLYDLFWSPDGKRIGGIAIDGFYVWEVDGLGAARKIPSLRLEEGSDPWSPDKKTLAMPVGIDRGIAVHLFEGDSDKPSRTLECETLSGTVWLRWSPDGKRLSLLSAAMKQAPVVVWDVASGNLLDLGKEMVPCQFAPSWSPDGKRLAVPGPDNAVVVYDVDAGKSGRTFQGHYRPVTATVFTPDGKTLVSTGFDRTVRFWDADSGKPRGMLLFLPDDQWVALSPEGHYRGSEKVEQFLSYTVKAEDGKVRDLTPAEFAKEYGWKNDPAKVNLLGK